MKLIGMHPALILSCCMAAGTAWPIGPAAPFVPPGKEAAAAATTGLGPDSGTGSGLAGVRLGLHAGALIDGNWVPQGAPVRGGRLESVRRDRVVLRRADGSAETLNLYSATAAPAASAATPAASQAPTATAER